MVITTTDSAQKMISGLEEEAENEDTFYFESDHLALRGNVDYSELLKTLFVLDAQRTRAIQDFNKITAMRKECSKDPLVYLEMLKNGKLDFPPMQQIAEVPKVDWNKYSKKIPEQFLNQIDGSSVKSSAKTESEAQATSNFTKNQWSAEEQRKLEELLQKYPPELHESHRYAKIAKELGTRTKHQVASRLQKYYLKLLKEGLPLPGPIPKTKNPRSRSKKYTKGYMKPTTFFPDTIIPVVMPEEAAPGPSNASAAFEKVTEKVVDQENYLLTNDYHVDQNLTTVKDVATLQVDILKAVKAEKLLEDPQKMFRHYGFKCDYCNEEPIVGTRWHCSICVKESVDYCNDCVVSQMFSSEEPHDLQHKFLIIRNDKEIAASPWSDDEEALSDNNEERNREEESSSEDSESNDSFANVPTNISMNHRFSQSVIDFPKVNEQCPVDIFNGVSDEEEEEEEDFDIVN